MRDAADRIIRRTEGLNVTHYHYSGPGDSPSYTTDLSRLVLLDRTVPLVGGVTLTSRVLGEVWNYPNIHGDVVATADSNGVKQGTTLAYDPFGQALTPSATANPDGVPDNSAGNFDYGWLGQYQRGLEHAPGTTPTIEMGARPYVPAIGRFLQVDPVEGGSANGYEYGAADPINARDTGGLCLERVTTTGDLWTLASGEDYYCFSYRPLTVTDSAGTHAINPSGDGCSAKTLIRGALGRAVGNRALRAFYTTCLTHDYLYDVLRAQAARGLVIYGLRAEADGVLWVLAGRVCGNTGYIGVWNKGSCQVARGVVYSGLYLWSGWEGDPPL